MPFVLIRLYADTFSRQPHGSRKVKSEHEIYMQLFRQRLSKKAYNLIVWDTKEPTHCSKRVGDVVPGVVVWPYSGRGHLSLP